MNYSSPWVTIYLAFEGPKKNVDPPDPMSIVRQTHHHPQNFNAGLFLVNKGAIIVLTSTETSVASSICNVRTARRYKTYITNVEIFKTETSALNVKMALYLRIYWQMM